jgi:Actin
VTCPTIYVAHSLPWERACVVCVVILRSLEGTDKQRRKYVGDADLGLHGMSSRGVNPRSAFVSGAMCNPYVQETVLDYTLSRLGVHTASLEHPVLITEPVAPPLATRQLLHELLFEAYGAPSVALGVDSAFAYFEASTTGALRPVGRTPTASLTGSTPVSCAATPLPSSPSSPSTSPASSALEARSTPTESAPALLVSCGESCVTVVPWYEGRLQTRLASRIDLGGLHMAQFLREILTYQYPAHRNHFTDDVCRAANHHYGRVVSDYHAEAMSYARGQPCHPMPLLQLPLPKRSDANALSREQFLTAQREMGERRQESGKRLAAAAALKMLAKRREYAATLANLIQVHKRLCRVPTTSELACAHTTTSGTGIGTAASTASTAPSPLSTAAATAATPSATAGAAAGGADRATSDAAVAMHTPPPDTQSDDLAHPPTSSASSASTASSTSATSSAGSALYTVCENVAALKTALRPYKLSTLKQLETRIGELTAILTDYSPVEKQGAAKAAKKRMSPELRELHTQECLLERADDTLTPLERVIQRKQRRRWRDTQTKARAHERKRAKQEAAADDERMLVDDPDHWGTVMQARRNQLFNDLQRAEASSAGLGVTGALTGVQTGKRRGAQQHRRMRAMASATRQSTDEHAKRREARFGARDEDWDVYRDMAADTSRDSERDADQQAHKRQRLRKEITRIDKLLQRYSYLLTDQGGWSSVPLRWSGVWWSGLWS